jgi:hypothetical protein
MRRRGKPGQAGGFTLVEMMVATTIAIMIAGPTLLLLLQAARTNASVFSDMTLDEAANTLQSQLVSQIRALGGGGGSQAAIYTNLPGVWAPPGLSYCLRVPYQMTSVGSTTIAQIAYDPNRGTVSYCPDYTTTANQQVFLGPSANVTVALFGFFPSIKGNGDNTLDLTLVNVQMELIHTMMYPTPVTNTVWRTFSVRMRTFP